MHRQSMEGVQGKEMEASWGKWSVSWSLKDEWYLDPRKWQRACRQREQLKQRHRGRNGRGLCKKP